MRAPGQTDEENRYAFDQTCRVTAIELASQLGVDSMLSINFLPNAVYRPETCIRATLEAARAKGFPRERLMFEVTESEEVRDRQHLKNRFTEYKRQGFTTAIDDFGACHSGLNLRADFQPDLAKLDMALTRDVDSDRVRRAIVAGIVRLCEELAIRQRSGAVPKKNPSEAFRPGRGSREETPGRRLAGQVR